MWPMSSWRVLLKTDVPRALLAKYAAAQDNLDEWGRISLAVVIQFPADANQPGSCRAEQALVSGGESMG